MCISVKKKGKLPLKYCVIHKHELNQITTTNQNFLKHEFSRTRNVQRSISNLQYTIISNHECESDINIYIWMFYIRIIHLIALPDIISNGKYMQGQIQ